MTEDAKQFEYEENKPDEIEVSLDISELIGNPNIAASLEEEVLKIIGHQVVQGYNTDLASRSHREAGMKLAHKFAQGKPEFPEKNTPWTKAANFVYPLISNAATTFGARAYSAIVKDGNVVDYKIAGNDEGVPMQDTQGNLIPDPASMQPQLDEEGQPIIDPMTSQPVMVPTQPLWKMPPGAKEQKARRTTDYTNWQFSSQMDNWDEDTDTMLHALPVTGNMYRKMYWDSEEEKIASHLVYPVNLVYNYSAPSIDRAPRLSEESEWFPYEIEGMIRSELWLDGDYLSQGEDEIEEESEAMEMIDSAEDHTKPHVFIEQCARYDLDGDGYEEPYIITVHKASGTVVRIVANYYEDGIKKNKEGLITKIEPETYYIHYPFIPSSDGSALAIGFGEWLLESNKAINSIMNQLLDAGTLANTSGGFIGRGLRMKGGSMKFSKGEFKIVDTRGGSIRENFVQVQHKEPSVVLFQLLGLMIDSAEKLAGLQDVLQGEQMANQAAITQMAAIEQGLTQFKSIHKRIQRSISKEIKVISRLNYLFLENDDYQKVMDTPVPVTKEDFDTTEFDIVPLANSYMVSDMQRMARLQYLDSLRGDPNIDQEGLRKEIFDLAGMEKMEKLIVPTPAMPEDPNVELQKTLMEVEGYKAEIKEQEMQYKAQMDAMKQERENLSMQMKLQESQQKAELERYKTAMDTQKQRGELEKMAMDIDAKAMEAQSKQALAGAQVQKIGVEVLKILSDIEMNEKGREPSEVTEENNDMSEIKDLLTQMVNKEEVDMSVAIQPLIDAVNEIKEVKGEGYSAEIETIKSVISNMGQPDLGSAIAPLADAIRSLKSEDKKKAIKIERTAEGNLTGEIEEV